MYEILSNCVDKNLKIYLIGKNYKTKVTINKVCNYLAQFIKKSLTKTNYCLIEGKFIGCRCLILVRFYELLYPFHLQFP